MAVLAPGGSPRFPRPISPRALPPFTPSSPATALTRCFVVGAGFIFFGRLATAICVTRPIRVRVLSLRLACLPRKASPAELLPLTLARLLDQRAIDKISSFQNIRSARLFLALRRTRRTRRVSDISNSELRDFRVLRGEHLLAYLVAALPRWVLRRDYYFLVNQNNRNK